LAQLSESNNYIGGRSLANLNPAVCQRLTGGIIQNIAGTTTCAPLTGTAPNFNGDVIAEALFYPKVLGATCAGALCGIRVAKIEEAGGSSVQVKITYEGNDVLVKDIEASEDLATVNETAQNCLGDEFLGPDGTCQSLSCAGQANTVYIPPSNSQVLNGTCEPIDRAQQVTLCPSGKVPSQIDWSGNNTWNAGGKLVFPIAPTFTCIDSPFDSENMAQAPTFSARTIASSDSGESNCPQGSILELDTQGALTSCACPTGSMPQILNNVQTCVCQSTGLAPSNQTCPSGGTQ